MQQWQVILVRNTLSMNKRSNNIVFVHHIIFMSLVCYKDLRWKCMQQKSYYE